MPSGSFKLELVISDEDDTPVYTKSDQKKADLFLNISAMYLPSSPKMKKNPLPIEMRNYKELSSIHITETTALQGLNKIKVNKSSGPDNIHLRVLHEISENITIPITNIIK